ncbi:P-loop containing nucleoside triphosphate hydrolase protein, partial [Mariannaea sp. PMI_226]
LLDMSPGSRIDFWRTRVPSRLDREDPFEGDGFGSRPATRLTVHGQKPPVRRPSTRLSFFHVSRSFEWSSPASSRPAISLPGDIANSGKKRKGILALFGRKRKQFHPPDAELTLPPAPVRLNFLFVGSRGSGQTSLLFRARYGYFPDVTNPLTLQDSRLYSPIDTSGVPDLNTIERLTYLAWDAIFLCFDISDKVSMYTIVQWWHHASSHGFGRSGSFEPMLYLLGMKKDMRDQCFLGDHREGAAYTSNLLAFPTCCVCASEASWHAERIGAYDYIECSAASGEGMEEVFDDIAQKAMKRALDDDISFPDGSLVHEEEKEEEEEEEEREKEPHKKRRMLLRMRVE